MIIVINVNIITIITAIAMFVIFFTRNEYNYLVSYSFKCYLSVEHLIYLTHFDLVNK